MKFLFLLIFLIFSCNNSNGQKDHDKVSEETNSNIISENKKSNSANTDSINNLNKSNQNTLSTKDTLKFEFEIIGEIYHNPKFYTQGYIYYQDFLYESTGQHGESGIYKINPKDGKVIQQNSLNIRFFGEGLEVYKDKLYLLTWRNQVCKVFGIKSFTEINEFRYVGEGWGLCRINDLFYMSDGSDKIQIKEPNSFSTIDYFSIEDERGYPLNDLNELEYAKGYIFANIWMTDKIVIIDPDLKKTIKIIDFSVLRSKLINNPQAEVLNGIAYDKENDIFYLTGKNWNKTFKVRIF